MNLNSFYLIAIAILLLGCKADQANSQAQSKVENVSSDNIESPRFTISDTSAGPFDRGAFLGDIELGPDERLVEKKADSQNQKYFSYQISGKEALQIYPAFDPRTDQYSQLIGSIKVQDERYKDDKGIAVGSTVATFFQAYPSAYVYYDQKEKEVVMSDQGHGPRYVLDASAIESNEQLPIGRIEKDRIKEEAKIKEVNIVRSSIENKDAMVNQGMEEEEIIENYLETLVGKYYLKTYSENYYKIHEVQGDFYVSECFEGECEERGKIVGAIKNNQYISLNLEGIEGEMVPTWTIEHLNSGEKALYVHDYDAMEDSWSDKTYFQSVD